MPEVPAVLENVFFDTAATPFLYQPEVYPTGVSLAGPDKVLFATDFPLIGYRRALGQVEESGLLPADREAIFGRQCRPPVWPVMLRSLLPMDRIATGS